MPRRRPVLAALVVAGVACSSLHAMAVTTGSGGGPGKASAARCGKLYVPNGRGNSVSVVDTTTQRVVKTVATGHNPAMAFATPDGSQVFLLDTNPDPPNAVEVMDTRTDTISSFSVPGMPFGAAISRDGKRLYVALTDAASVGVYDVRTHKPVASFPFPTVPLSVALSGDSSTLYVAFATNQVGAYDARTGAVRHAPLAVGSTPAWISLSPDSSHLYALNGGDSNVSVLDTKAWKAVGKPIPTDGTPITSWNSPNGTYVYFAGSRTEGGGVVVVVDAHTLKVVRRMVTPGAAQSVSFSDDGKTGYIPEWGPGSPDLTTTTVEAFGHVPYSGPAGELSLFDATTNRLLGGERGTIAVGDVPGTAVCQFGNHEPGR